VKITSRQNERVKGLLELREKSGRERGKFIIEGDREIERARNSRRVRPLECWFCGEQPNWGITSIEVSPCVFEKISYRGSSHGALMVAAMDLWTLDEVTLDGAALVLVAESIEKPGNLGALMRTAESVGATALVYNGLTDLLNPNVIRASTGTLFSLPVIACDSETALSFFQKHTIRCIATTPHATTPYWQADFTHSAAIWIGSENEGLLTSTMNACQQQVSIPQKGSFADSLNANVAAALVLYEAIRQRTLNH